MAASRRLALLAAMACVVSLATGCLEPTLPLPPPGRPDVSPPDSRGITTVVGGVPGGTTAVVENLRSGELVWQATDERGGYKLTLSAEVDDRLAVYYFKSLTRSQSIVVLVPKADLSPGVSDGGTGDGGAGGAGDAR